MPQISLLHRWAGIFPTLLVLAMASNATAQITMVSSLGETRRDSDVVAVDGWTADKFTTSSSSGGFDLTSVIIQMSVAEVDHGNYFVAIYSDGGGLPGTQVGSLLTGTTAPGAAIQYTYIASDVHLAANTPYWMVQGVTAGDSSYSPDYEIVTPTITDIWTLTGIYTFSENAAASWEPVGTDSPILFSLQAKVIPEPADFGLMGGAVCLAVGVVVRRRRKLDNR